MDNQPVVKIDCLLAAAISQYRRSPRSSRLNQRFFSFKGSRETWFKGCVIGLVLLLSAVIPQTYAGNSASQIMSSAMLAMMDTMGDLAHRYKRGDNWYNDSDRVNPYPYPYYGPPAYANAYPPAQPSGSYALPPYYRNLPRSEVDGIWIGQGGEIVLVMYGYFRVYADAETYRDGRYEIDQDLLRLYDLANGASQTYQYALDSGRMIMRNRQGQILLFKQLPIPIPLQSLLPKPEPQTGLSSETDLTEEPNEATE
ncbi:MAG: hypothetical protein P8163_13780 [Candidatus Thiodiazotropha sp.]|jgi:hypothetical protein